MAKSQRASSRKRNNAALRSKVFQPSTDARTERLSAKLQELASQPKPEEEKAMDVDEPEEESKEEGSASADAVDEEMDVDAQPSKRKASKKLKSSTSNNPSRVSKHRVMKPKKAKNNVIFPDLQARKQRQKERRAQGKR